MHWKKRTNPDGTKVFVSDDPSIILRDMREYILLPGHDEPKLAREGRYYEAIMVLAARIDNYLRHIYLAKQNRHFVANWVRLQRMTFGPLLEEAHKKGIITDADEYAKLIKLRDARNILAHDNRALPKYVDPERAQKLLDECIPIEHRLFGELPTLNKQSQ